MRVIRNLPTALGVCAVAFFNVPAAKAGTLTDVPESLFEFTHSNIPRNSDSVFWSTWMNTISLSFAGGTWSGHFNSDFLIGPCSGGGCNASGILAEVPKPVTIWVLGFGSVAVVDLARFSSVSEEKEAKRLLSCRSFIA